jgi:spore germination cell wall hydrolase CwlJ-like protein
MNKIFNILIAIIALTAMAPGHAEVNKKDLECLARNIYYEAGMESEEGKAAVGLVTINRSRDDKFPKSICGVVSQKTIKSHYKTVSVTKVQHDSIGRKKLVTEDHTVVTSQTICQFSWQCGRVAQIDKNDEHWNSSLRVARELLEGGYNNLRDRFADAMYFHNTQVKPAWAKQKQRIEKIGSHIFYADHN